MACSRSICPKEVSLPELIVALRFTLDFGMYDFHPTSLGIALSIRSLEWRLQLNLGQISIK